MILCPKCGTETADEATVCPSCLTPLEEFAESGRTGETRGLAPTKVTPKPSVESITCSACGASNIPAYLFCQKCGASLKQPSAKSAEPVEIPGTQPAADAESGAPSPAQPAVTAEAAEPSASGAAAKLVLIMENGGEGDAYPVGEKIVIGRRTGDLTFPHDDYMSGRHARIEKQGNRFILTDEASRNGIFIKIDKEVEVRSGDLILIGKQLFRFET
jgi:uncharacterized OB-fold protein